MVYSEVGDTKNAIEMLRQVTGKDPNPRTLSALASFYDQTRDFPSAADAWRQALQLDPENSRIKRALAQDVCFTDHLDEALKLYNEIAAADPRDMQMQLAALRRFTARRVIFAKARAAFNKAKETGQGEPGGRYEEA